MGACGIVNQLFLSENISVCKVTKKLKEIKTFVCRAFYLSLQVQQDYPIYMRDIYFLIFSLFAINLPAQTVVTIPQIQGNNNLSPYNGKSITTSGIVTACFFGNGSINGFFLQDKTGDGNSNTSDGIFVYSPVNSTIQPGDEIRLTAAVSEFDSRTQLSNVTNLSVFSKNNTIAPVKLVYDLRNWNWEQYEGMLVEFQHPLWVNNNYYLEKYGELELGVKRRPSPTNVALPGSSAYSALISESALLPIYLDDGFTSTYRSPIAFADHYGARRTGELVDKLCAVVDYSNSKYLLYPVGEVKFFGNPRERTHRDIGEYNLKVCGFNLEYYLTSPNSSSMGPSTQEEVDRQHAKILDALLAIDADVYGLVEVEQGQQALSKLVAALNQSGGGRRYSFINDGGTANGTYTKAAFLYRSDKVAPYQALREVNNPSPANRKKLQAFTLKSNNERFVYSINHLKAKSGCQSAIGENADTGDGQSCYNATRVAEAKAVVAAANSATSYYDDDDVLVMGDLNAYAKEDPIQVFITSGYIDLLQEFHADSAYSYVYRTEAGYLDHALANKSLAKQITGVTPFHINADELTSFGYSGGQATNDMFRSSDHDPIIVGIVLGKNVNSNLLEFEERVKIYPTLVHESLHVDMANEAYIQIYSLNGVKLFQDKIDSDTFTLELHQLTLAPGAYIVRVLGEQRIVRQVIFVK